MLTYQLRRVTFPFIEPAGTSRGVMLERTSWFIYLYDTYAGHHYYGVGECAPLPGLSIDPLSDPTYEQVLHKACRLWCSTATIDKERLRAYPSVLFGLETAIRSLEADRTYGDPFHLYDTPFARGEEGIPINGLVWMGTEKQMMQRLEAKLASGFSCIKIKIGAINFEKELALLRHIRSQYSSDRIQIRVDANGAFSPTEALERLYLLAPYHIHSIEQPIRAGQWEEMAHLCLNSPIPIALDEELIGDFSEKRKEELLDKIRPDYLVLKPSLHGGISGAEEWMRLAANRDIHGWVTSALESNCGLMAISSWLSHLLEDSSPLRPFLNVRHQGLGTGALYTKNFPGTNLHLEGERIWGSRAEDEVFRRELQSYRKAFRSSGDYMMVHTSGSTGKPQPLMAQKSRMVASARRTCRALSLRPDDTALLCMPLRYIAAQMMVVRAESWPLRLTAVHPSSHPLANLDFSPDFIAMTPMQAYATMQVASERERLLQTRVVLLGGGEISDELAALLYGHPGQVWSSYGMTETLSNVALRRINGPLPSAAYTPMEGVKVTTDPQTKTLIIHDPLTNENPLHTHDIAQIHADGTFSIVGRTDNIICSGGIKISPEPLERQLRPHLPMPFLLTATPDPEFGQALTFVFEGTAEQIPGLRDKLRGLLQGPLCPRIFRAVTTLPRTETGKVKRI